MSVEEPRVIIVPQLLDNYAYLVIDPATLRAAVVDPADAGPVLAAIERAGATLDAILNTHHHADHTGGNLELLAARPGVRVIGSTIDADRIPGLTTAVGDRDRIAVGSLAGEAILVPCHTRGHVAYRFGRDLFTGDTLFAAGCGRFFEGDAADMHRALSTLASLEPETRVYCGHEYTEKNLEFARSIEPGNKAAARKLEEVRELRKRAQPSVPTTLAEERAYNPFLRPHSGEIKEAVAAARPDVDVADPVAVVAVTRELKNRFS